MTPEQLADLCARAYEHMTPWSARSFADTLARPQALLSYNEHAFVLGLVIAGEAEILALAADPDHQRQGHAADALRRFHNAARARDTEQVFLEVASRNAPARAFYARHAYRETGRRPGYYPQTDGTSDDALIMSRHLPPSDPA